MKLSTQTKTHGIRRLTGLGIAGVLALAFAGKATAAERWETLQAIHMVENPNDSTRPGPFGELGAYQFRRETWQMYTTRPFSEALNRERSDEIAVRHYEQIKSTLAQNGISASVYNIALAWNSGIGAVIGHTSPKAAKNYASRVSNIVADLHGGSATRTAVATSASKPVPVKASQPKTLEPMFLAGGPYLSLLPANNRPHTIILEGDLAAANAPAVSVPVMQLPSVNPPGTIVLEGSGSVLSLAGGRILALAGMQ